MLAIAAAGCGSDRRDPGRSAADPGAGSYTSLRITLDVDGPGGAPAKRKLVTCGQASADCDLGLPTLPAETPPDAGCTEIFGGPETVKLEGRLRGEPVEAKLARANGCEIARFDPFVPALEKLFPGYRPGGAIGG